MITFHSLVENVMQPVRATKCANGTLPTRGFRYCEPVRVASGFGWYVHLPMDIWFVWDGYEVEWSIDDGDVWYPLGDAIQYPGFSSAFSEAAPADVGAYAQPFVGRTNDPDILQIWTGLILETPSDLSILVRGPVNAELNRGFDVIEGVIDTDWWFGPLFTNIRLGRKGKPIILRSDRPFVQVQPFSRPLYRQFEGEKATVRQGLDAMEPEHWGKYRRTVVRRMETRERLGDYAVEARRGRPGKRAE